MGLAAHCGLERGLRLDCCDLHSWDRRTNAMRLQSPNEGGCINIAVNVYWVARIQLGKISKRRSMPAKGREVGVQISGYY
jgi:hypothetical protein